jgi:ubiquitin-protein ligase
MRKNARGGRATNNAALRANIIGEQSNSVRRLQKDLKELREADVPLFGVTACPLDNSIFKWHGNLRGPEGSAFKGGVFHVSIEFPQNYPVSPPDVKLFTEIPHPNVFGKTICLDMLQKAKPEAG